MVRAGDGSLSPITWEEAVQRVADADQKLGRAVRGPGRRRHLERGGLARPADPPRGRVLQHRLLVEPDRRRPARPALPSRARLADVGPRQRRRDPGDRDRSAARDADPRPSDPQGRPAVGREPDGGLGAADRTRRRGGRGGPLRPGRRRLVHQGARGRAGGRRLRRRGPLQEGGGGDRRDPPRGARSGDHLGRAAVARRPGAVEALARLRPGPRDAPADRPGPPRGPRGVERQGTPRGRLPAGGEAGPRADRPAEGAAPRSRTASPRTSSERCCSSTATRSAPTPTRRAGERPSPDRSSSRSRPSRTSPPSSRT